MKSYYGGPVGTHKRSCERYHPRPPTASHSPILGVRNPNPKLQSLIRYIRIISGTGKATNFKFGRFIHKYLSEQKPIKIW